ncbi:MAG: PhnD/SsuA/transferrin family substrate-binding protein [Candidatus Sumerlaeia bacterium]|nr:PhnD/SsuA/transferrin family substrate-binding protein [Candidatus Sumerlaeia bacterium]
MLIRIAQVPILLLSLLLLLPPHGFSQPLGTVTPPAGSVMESDGGELLRIGYLRREATGHPGERLLENFRQRLLDDTQFREALREAGYTGDNPIGLFPCDGAEDMVRRLNTREFDLAFTPATIYARQQADYQVVLKARRPGDSFSPGGVVRRFGVVFVSPRSPLFNMEEITADDLKEELNRQRLAVVSTQSVAGFHAPLLELSRFLGTRHSSAGYLWFENSNEVVKAVLSGLTDIGVCELSAIDQVLASNGLLDPEASESIQRSQRDRYVREVLKTRPVITDPVLMRPELAQRQSALGRQLITHLREASLEGDFGPIQYLTSNNVEYRGLVDLLRQFDRTVGEVVR